MADSHQPAERWIAFMITYPTQTEHGFRTDIGDGDFSSIDDAIKACEVHAAARGDILEPETWVVEMPATHENKKYDLPDRYYHVYKWGAK